MKRTVFLLLFFIFCMYAKSNMPPPMYAVSTGWKFTNVKYYTDYTFYILYNNNKLVKIIENQVYKFNAENNQKPSYRNSYCRIFYKSKHNPSLSDTAMLYVESSYQFVTDYFVLKTIKLHINGKKLDCEEIAKQEIKVKKNINQKKQTIGTFLFVPFVGGKGGNMLLVVLSFLSLIIFVVLFYFRQKQFNIANV